MFLRLAALFIKIQMNIITGLLAVIKQWGNSKSESITFPLKFSAIYVFLRCNISNSSSNTSYRSVGCISRDVNGAQVLVPDAVSIYGGYDWIAAGKA